MEQTLVTCTLVPTKNKSLVLCQPIVLSPVFAIILLLTQKLCSPLQQFYTPASSYRDTDKYPQTKNHIFTPNIGKVSLSKYVGMSNVGLVFNINERLIEWRK